MRSALQSPRRADRWSASTAKLTGASDTSSSSVRPRLLTTKTAASDPGLIIVELPVDIHAMDATYETQFGTVGRPTHRNTSWDQAKFEVCAHRFADLSEFGYGVALINDCKYGYGIEGQTIRLSLLRSPTAPDAEQDQGLHQFSFAIVPHVGTFAQSCVIPQKLICDVQLTGALAVPPVICLLSARPSTAPCSVRVVNTL